MDKTKTERVKGVGFRDLWAISTLDEFRAVASKIEALVPIEFHATIKFDVSVDDDFGSFTVTYERPETDFERIDRERSLTQIIERDKAREFAEYQRLKEKFDPPGGIAVEVR